MAENPMPPLVLKDLIMQVRHELIEASKESERSGEAPILKLDDVTLEVNFVVETQRKVSGEASAKLLAVVGADMKGEHSYSKEQIHKITVHFSGASQADSPSLLKYFDVRQTPQIGMGGGAKPVAIQSEPGPGKGDIAGIVVKSIGGDLMRIVGQIDSNDVFIPSRDGEDIDPSGSDKQG